MSKLNPGDRVVIDGHIPGPALVGTITRVALDFPDVYWVELDLGNKRRWFEEHRLLLVSSARKGVVFMVWNGKCNG